MSLVQLSAIDHVFVYAKTDPPTFVIHFPSELDVGRLVETFHEAVHACEGAGATLVQRDGTCYLDLSRDVAQIEEALDERDTPLRECVAFAQTDFGVPLVRARITRLGRGRGMALSLSLSHVVADGYGTFLLLAAWAARARGEAAFPVNCDRSLLTNQAARSRRFEIQGKRFRNAGFSILERDEPFVRLRWRFEERSRSALTAMAEGLSFNDSLCATIWKEVAASRNAEDDASLCFLVDIRRFRPELGTFFFGNAVIVATVERRAHEVVRASLAEVGQWIRQAVAEAPGRVDAAVAELESARATYGVEFFKRVRSIHTYAYAVTNMSRLPYETLDFGSGPPVAFHLGSLPQAVPSCAVMPGRDADHVLIVAAVP